MLEKRRRLNDLLAAGADRRIVVSVHGTQYHVFRFTDGTLGVRRGGSWILYSNGTISEVKKRASRVFGDLDVREVMKS